ncbi:MAG: methyltransferase domain-containing protein [Planctomycetota bacterium]|nr:methyltransferase domain-containing protein [Planctomycetaceae bacterium]MDQ3330981.1 methyltransferase domain-containing protein [Planctomycetota bacterium]
MFFLSPDLSARDRQPELMDQPGLAEDAHRAALRGLARVNRLSFSARSIWRPIVAEMKRQSSRRWRLLDVACGSGDVPLALAGYAATERLILSVAGCDMSDTAVVHANERARQSGAAADFFVRDAIRDGLPGGYDFVTCSLFLHHLAEADVVRLLRAIGDAAGTLGVISDLRRTTFGYALACFGTRVLSRSRVVHIDGPLSVRSAFSLEEASNLADEAGLGGRTSIRPVWPQRFLLTIGPPA